MAKVGDIVKIKGSEIKYIIVAILPSKRVELVREADKENYNPNLPENTIIVRDSEIIDTGAPKPKIYYFRTALEERERFDKEIHALSGENKEYYERVQDGLRKEFADNAEWFATKKTMPATYDDGLKRTEYTDMPSYIEFKEKFIRPLIADLRFDKSMASLFEKKLKYNDREIGVFDFNKASINLLPSFVYYSEVHKMLVPPEMVEIRKTGSDYLYFYKKDSTPVVLVEKADDSGATEFYSTIKKCYLSHEKTPKPYNALRIFCQVGYNASIPATHNICTGYLGLALHEIFE